MSSLTKALDNMELGENNHIQLKWNKESFEEMVTQFYFQLVRTTDMTDLRDKFKFLLWIYNADLLLLAKLTMNVRDLNGKGERQLTYMMLLEWWNKQPEFAYYIFETMMLNKDQAEPYASWKDIKYLCKYIKDTTSNSDHPFINWLVELTNHHLKIDWDNLIAKKNTEISLLGKWIPREKSQFAWLHAKLVKNMFSRYYETAKTPESKKAAGRKARKEYRLICSTINKFLDTTQIKQCNGNWRYIDPNTVTSITFSKQKQALFNQKMVNRKLIERSENEDRKKCKENFVGYLNEKKEKNETIKGKRCSLYDFVKDAIKYGTQTSECDEETKLLKDTINSQWENNSKQNFSLNNMISLVDTSGSMECDNCQPLYNAIGLGIRIAEKTSPAFRNRVMTFSADPTWIDLDGESNFCDKVQKVRTANWGMNTDIYKAFQLILAAIEKAKMSVEDVENLTLVILSDMQIDNSCGGTWSSSCLFDSLKSLFHEKGLEICGRPYSTPNILFWNLRKTNGFPSQTTEKNVTMLSGFNPMLLNTLCDKGFEELKNCTPYTMLLDLLNSKRYDNINSITNIML
jgi:hypothetical protein